MGDTLKRNRRVTTEWDFSGRKIWRVGVGFLWQLNRKEKDEQGRLREENRGTLWGFFLEKWESSLEAKVARIGKRLSRWGFCNLHILHFLYIVLLSFLVDSVSIICCLGTITRDSMTSYRFGIVCKFQAVLFSYVFRLQFDSDVHLSLKFLQFFSSNYRLNLTHLSLIFFSLFFFFSDSLFQQVINHSLLPWRSRVSSTSSISNLNIFASNFWFSMLLIQCVEQWYCGSSRSLWVIDACLLSFLWSKIILILFCGWEIQFGYGEYGDSWWCGVFGRRIVTAVGGVAFCSQVEP